MTVSPAPVAKPLAVRMRRHRERAKLGAIFVRFEMTPAAVDRHPLEVAATRMPARQGRRDQRISQIRHGCAVAGTVRMSCITFVARSVVRLALTAGIFLASLVPGKAEPAPAIYYAPGENLEHVDVELINRNEREIDMAAICPD